jgi:uncharacterized protein YecT (DUF1311 family)
MEGIMRKDALLLILAAAVFVLLQACSGSSGDNSGASVQKAPPSQAPNQATIAQLMGTWSDTGLSGARGEETFYPDGRWELEVEILDPKMREVALQNGKSPVSKQSGTWKASELGIECSTPSMPEIKVWWSNIKFEGNNLTFDRNQLYKDNVDTNKATYVRVGAPPQQSTQSPSETAASASTEPPLQAASTPAPSQTASDPCDNNMYLPELTECREKQYQTADDELNRVYKGLMALLDEGMQKKLREEQREWITLRDKEADEAAEGGSHQGVQRLQQLTESTQKRTAELKAQIAERTAQ